MYVVLQDSSSLTHESTCSAWRHWGCVTPKIITNMKAQFENADELDGYDDLKDEDQERIRKAWDDGHVADEDIPETARKSNDEEEDEDDGKPSKKKGDKKGADSNGKFKLEYASSGRAKCKGEFMFTSSRSYLLTISINRWMHRFNRKRLLQSGPRS